MTSVKNPLATDPQRQAHVRARAKYLWEADGKPEGREAEYEERARELVAMEENPEAGQRAPQDTADRPEEASIQKNLGEFPSRFTDQGDRKQTPGGNSSS